MDVEKLLNEKDEYIIRLENCLIHYDEISDKLLVETVKIVNEVDEKGKKIFSNDNARQDELRRRCEKDFLDKRKLKISLEILRLKTDALTDKIKFNLVAFYSDVKNK